MATATAVMRVETIHDPRWRTDEQCTLHGCLMSMSEAPKSNPAANKRDDAHQAGGQGLFQKDWPAEDLTASKWPGKTARRSKPSNGSLG